MAVRINQNRQSKRFQNMKFLRVSGIKRNGQVLINVTALVDMMTVLVIFLIMQFSTTGEMLFITKDLQIPNTKNGAEITREAIISLNRLGDLYFEGALIAPRLKPAQANASWEIMPLLDKLKTLKGKKSVQETINARDHIVNIQVDKSVDYSVLKRVLHTCEMAGYGKIRLAVSKEIKQATNLNK